MRGLIGLAPALWLAAVPAAAQTGLSLDQARQLARGQSLPLAAAGHAVTAAAGGVRAARAELLPSLAAVASHVDYDGDVFYARFINPQQPGMPNPAAPPTDVGDFASTRAAVLKLSQPLYAGGALKSRLRASRVERRLAEQERRRQELDLDLEVTKAYYGVLLAERSFEVAGDSVRRSQESLEIVRRRRAEEEALEVEVLGAETQLARDRQRRRVAEGDLRFARRALARLLGREAGPESRVPGAPPEGGEWVLSDPLETPPRQLEEAEAVRRALARHPALALGELRLGLAEESLKAARAHFKPKLELEGYHAWIDSETFFEGSTFGFDLKISIPFLRDAAAGGGAVAQAAAGRELEASRHRETVSQVRLLAGQAVRRAQDAYGAIEVARQALAYQREKHRVTASAFREQLATAGDLLAEHAALAEAQLRLLSAHHEARIAEAELDRIAPVER